MADAGSQGIRVPRSQMPGEASGLRLRRNEPSSPLQLHSHTGKSVGDRQPRVPKFADSQRTEGVFEDERDELRDLQHKRASDLQFKG